MGENVLEYNGVLFDEDDPYSDRDDDCSLSEDDFLELPFNDRTVCKHWLKVMKYTLLDITRCNCNLGHLNVSSKFFCKKAKHIDELRNSRSTYQFYMWEVFTYQLCNFW